MSKKTNYFDRQEVLLGDLNHDQEGRIESHRNSIRDHWSNGIISDPNGLSNLAVTIDGTTATLLNVSHGSAYANGRRLSISSNKTFGSSEPFATTDGICTPQSTGNRAIPLVDYTNQTWNHIWLEYLNKVNTSPFTLDPIVGTKKFTEEDDGYRVYVSTNNYPGNPEGITDSVYLGSVKALGSSVALESGPTGLTSIQAPFSIPKVFSSELGLTHFIKGQHLYDDSISREKLKLGIIGPNQISDDAVTYPKLADNILYKIDSCIVVNSDSTKGDYTTLYDAVTAVNSGDARSILITGTSITESQAISLTASNVKIYSLGKTSILRNFDSKLLSINATDVTIEGLIFSEAGANASARALLDFHAGSIRVVVRNCVFTCPNPTVNSPTGVEVDGRYQIISGCTFKDVGRAINVACNSSDRDLYQVIITNNFIDLTGNTYAATTGISFTNGTVQVTGNRIVGVTNAIYSTGISYRDIQNNYMRGNGDPPEYNGFVYLYNNYGVFSNNQIYTNGDYRALLIGHGGTDEVSIVENNIIDNGVSSSTVPISIPFDDTFGANVAVSFYHGNQINSGAASSWIGGTNSMFRDNLRLTTFEADS